MSQVLPADSDQRCCLCLESRPLRRSHIIPEYCYKALYDDKHRLVTFPPEDVDSPSFEQKGLREPLLCDDCEQHINENGEKSFHEYWIAGQALSTLESCKGVYLEGIDYPSFKLFHMSVLFRASASKHPNFQEVQLGPHHERLRQMILQKNVGEEYEYLITCTALEKPSDKSIWHELVTPAHRVRTASSRGYYFVFAGAQWIYHVSRHYEPVLNGTHLTADGRLPVMRMPLLAARVYREMIAQSKLHGQSD